MSATGSAAPARAQGFTLIEMLVVLAISALVAGLLFPSVERMTARAELLAARSLVAAELSQARSDALRFDRRVQVSVARDGGSLAHGDAVAIPMPAEIRIEGVPAILGFYPDGSASGGRITLTGDRLVTGLDIDARHGGVAARPVVSRTR
ncbi:MAG: pilus assembly FimT family protein [Sandaracinobacteroides sp.]